jgi:glycogen debranching enzyme
MPSRPPKNRPERRNQVSPHVLLGGARPLPDRVTISAGWSRLTVDHTGQMPSRGRFGLFTFNTRVLSGWQLTLGGQPLEPALCGQVSPTEWYGTFRVPGSTEEGNLDELRVPEGGVELRIRRHIAVGVREEWHFVSYANRPRRLQLELRLEARMGDEMDVQRQRDAGDPVTPTVESDGLRFEHDFGERKYTPTDALERESGRAPRGRVRRGVRVHVVEGHAEGDANGFLITAELPPRGEARLVLDYRPLFDGEELPVGQAPRPVDAQVRIETGNPIVDLIIRQARQDLDSLELPVPPGGDGPPTLAAGLPLYLGLFGRDSLTACWQSALFCRRWMLPVLERLARLQADGVDLFREAEPGRMPHERRLGPRGAVGRRPYELYYGDVVGPPFWVVTLTSAVGWLGSDIIEPHFATAERCIGWVERELERGLGLVWDAPFPGGATRNHAWKDSGDAIVDGRGRVRVPPLALIEEQGYCHLALLSFALLLLLRGHPVRARHYQKLAAELRRRCDEQFWMPHERYYALAIGRDGDQIDSITSNPGHALGCGLFPPERVPDVVRRLVAPDLFSGWGVRTLSTENPAYDPFSYHRGSVWPVENATIAGALTLWGARAEAERVIEAQLLAASCFDQLRLPEVFGGQPRDADHPLPSLYPDANPIQAWSASAVSLMLQSLLGIRAVAPLHTLLVAPRLPEWLPEVILRGLAVGDASCDLHFWRTEDGATRWRILGKQGRLKVREQTSLVDLQTGTLKKLLETAELLI